MNIGIDARPLIEKKSGIGYFLEYTLKNILELDQKNIYYLISDKEIYFDISNYKNVKKYIYGYGKVIKKSFFYFLKLHKKLEKDNIKLDVFWGTQHFIPKRLNCRTVLTIHDLSFKLFPKTVDFKVRLISDLMFKSSVRMADDIVCVSNYTKKVLTHEYKDIMGDKKTHVIYIAGNDDNYEMKKEEIYDELIDKYKFTNRKYILFISTIEPRKNIDVLLNAFYNLNDKMDLVICGKIGWKCEQIEQRINNMDNVYYLNYVTDQEKAYLLKNAYVFVMPSLYEGFGIPVVEAMQMDIPVVVADNSSLKEIVQMSKLRFETHNYKQLNEILNMLYDNKEFYQKAKQYSMNRKKDFTWEKTALQYIKVFKGEISKE